MILILRGHIRNSFDTNELYTLIKAIYTIFPDLKIFIHTWNVFSNNISWREITVNNTPVTFQTIFDYFKDLKVIIKGIMIDNDRTIPLIGKLDGNINGGPMKLIGWKNYWYGKYKIVEYLHGKINKEEMVINCRFDVLNNSNSFTVHSIIKFIINNNTKNKNTFLFEDETCGIDNIYMGTIETMYILSHKFHYNLDAILQKHNNVVNQEKLVFRINKELFSI